MEHGLIHIQTPVGAIDCDVELEEQAGEWIAILVAKPGVVGAARVTAPTRTEAMERLTDLAQRDHEEAVERELKLYGGRAPSL